MAQKSKGNDVFPDRIYVAREADGDDTFLTANESHESIDDGERVAIYELREVKTKHVTHDLKD